MTNQLSFHFFDEDGAKATHQYPVSESIILPDQPLVETLRTAIDNATNAGVSKVSLVFDKVPGAVVPGSGPYDAEDKMVHAFSTVGGVALRMAVPAPIRALMAADDESWAAGEALIDSLASAAAAVVVTKGGAAITGLTKAFRSRFNRSRR
jgi:hypothetical protein